MRGHEEAVTDLRDAAEFAIGVLKHCVLNGPGCDDAKERQIAIAMLTDALDIKGA